jgi:tRNA dimethylallyltransferase
LTDRDRPDVLIAVLGATGSGKSALALALAERLGGEIISCDSAAVYRGFDIGTDKLAPSERRGIPHHLVDVADPQEQYSAARFAADAAAVVHEVHRRGRVPILAGGTGFYYRALTRGLFPGPGRNDELRRRLKAIEEHRGPGFLHRMVTRVDPSSAARIQARDAFRLVRALEVYFLTGRPLTEHFAQTTSPLAGVQVVPLLVHVEAKELQDRIARRVARHFERGLVREVEGLLAAGIPREAAPFGSLGYRQVLEYLDGVRGEQATRDLVVQETRQYARRQLIWFRKEPNLGTVFGPGELESAIDAAARFVEIRSGRILRFSQDSPRSDSQETL